MYVNPFYAGIFVGIVISLVTFFILVIYFGNKERDKKNEEEKTIQ